LTKREFREFFVAPRELITVTVTALNTPYSATFSDLSNPQWKILQNPTNDNPVEIRTYSVPAKLPQGDSFTLLLNYAHTGSDPVPDDAMYRIQIEGNQGTYVFRENMASLGRSQRSASYGFTIGSGS